MLDEDVILVSQARFKELEKIEAEVIRSREYEKEKDILFNLIINSHSEMFCLVDPIGNILYASPSHANIIGCPADEDSIGDSALKYVHPDDEDRLLGMFLEAIQTGSKNTKAEYRMKHVDGHFLWMETVGDFLFDEEGEIKGAGLFTRDITQRKRLEENLKEYVALLTEANRELALNIKEREVIESRLRQSEEIYRLNFEFNPAGVTRTIYDPVTNESKFFECNEAFAKILGFASKNEILGLDISESSNTFFYSHEDRNNYIHLLFKNRKLENYKVRLQKKDGSPIWVLLNMNVRNHEDGKFIIEGTTTDITAQIIIEDRLRAAQKKLRAMASEMVLADERSRQHFAADLHDSVVQTLGAAKLRAQLSKEFVSEEGIKLFNELEDMISQSLREARLIMAAMSPPVLYELGFIPAVEWLSEQFETRHNLPIEFKKRGSFQTLSHEIQVTLFQAIRELLMNIVKHADAKRAIIKISGATEKIRIEVIDDGKGFKDPILSRDKYSGYGLFSIRERLKHLGGKINIRSELGKGTRIVIFAPRMI